MRACCAVLHAGAYGNKVFAYFLEMFFDVSIGGIVDEEKINLMGDVLKRFVKLVAYSHRDSLIGDDALDYQKIEHVEGHGDVAGEDLAELAIFLCEGGEVFALDVHHADDFIIDAQGNSEGALRALYALDVEGILADIVAEVGEATGSDVACNTVLFKAGAENEGVVLWWNIMFDNQDELVGFFVEQADCEVVKVQEAGRNFNYSTFEQFKPLHGVVFSHYLGIKAHEVCSGLIDGGDFLLESFGRGDIGDYQHERIGLKAGGCCGGGEGEERDFVVPIFLGH